MLTDGSVSLKTFVSLPDFAFVSGLKGLKEFDFTYFATIFVAYVPVALVVLQNTLLTIKTFLLLSTMTFLKSLVLQERFSATV